MPVDQPTPPCDADAGGQEGDELRHPADSLPPDLMELAAQLGDDAAFLATRYQAPSFDFGIAASPKVVTGVATRVATQGGASAWRFTHRLPLAAAVLLAAVGIGLVVTDYVADEEVTGFAAAPLLRNHGGADEHGAGEHSGPVAIDPVVSFELFTGPEQEAVLDLLEEEGVRQGSLSI